LPQPVIVRAGGVFVTGPAEESGTVRRPGRILLLDDDRGVREMTADYLRSLGHEVDDVATLEQARARVRARPYELVLTDLLLEHGTGLDLLEEIRAEGLPCEVIVMTGHGTIDAAVRAIRSGAYDFVTKPLNLTRLELDVAKALDKHRLEQDVRRLREGGGTGFGEMIAIAPAMQPVVNMLRRAADADSNVLLLGESGTGKEVAARAVHAHSARKEHPFRAVHCGAIPEHLLESELFGHTRGAFTGADASREGLFVAANGGTIFLDEIGTAPAGVQVSLLRVLQERKVRPVGSDRDLDVDVRIIAATNADLESEMEQGRFRQDLYFRLATIVVRMPPLRERREDIPALAARLLGRLNERIERQLSLSPRALERLAACEWPGNVRELEHLLERVAVMVDGNVIRARDLPLEQAGTEGSVPTLEEVERDHVRAVLALCSGNKKKAARVLGIPRGSLYRKLERYGLTEAPQSDPPPDPPLEQQSQPSSSTGSSQPTLPLG
jgi:two-component system response regulator HydG